jgi:hypothetical protein
MRLRNRHDIIRQVDQRRMGTELHHVVDDNKTLTAALDTLKIDYDDLKFRLHRPN